MHSLQEPGRGHQGCAGGDLLRLRDLRGQRGRQTGPAGSRPARALEQFAEHRAAQPLPGLGERGRTPRPTS